MNTFRVRVLVSFLVITLVVILGTAAVLMATSTPLKADLITGLLILVAVGVAVALGLTKFTTHKMFDSIRELSSGLKTLVIGHIDLKLQIPKLKEFEPLFDDFNEMAHSVAEHSYERQLSYDYVIDQNIQIKKLNDSLNRQVFEKNILLNIAKTSNYLIDYQDILESILERLVRNYRFERASIMLLDKSNNAFELKAAMRFDSETQDVKRIDPKPIITLKRHEGIAGNAIARGEAAVAKMGSQDPRFKKYNNSYDEQKESLICLPLISKSIAIGVLNLTQNRERPAIRRHDIHFLMDVATQIANSVESAMLYYTSITDELTQVYNVRHFRVRLDAEISRTGRTSGCLALIIFDIDHFKNFNDTYGHQIGDRVLENVGQIMDSVCRRSDIPARYGGEEFALILPDTEKEGAFYLAEKLRSTIETTTLQSEKGPLKYTVSVGLALFPQHADSLEELIKNADTALYAAKRTGRNKTVIYSLDEQLMTRPN